MSALEAFDGPLDQLRALATLMISEDDAYYRAVAARRQAIRDEGKYIFVTSDQASYPDDEVTVRAVDTRKVLICGTRAEVDAAWQPNWYEQDAIYDDDEIEFSAFDHHITHLPDSLASTLRSWVSENKDEIQKWINETP